jgi:hypothetical protein
VENDKEQAERELMHLNGRMADLMDKISDLEEIDDPEPYQESMLSELKIEETNLARQIETVESYL